ncbi:hypothetical protein LWI29_012864 [Acer saccharum]|uniref:Uncharacterized protein n=1 Tax=Acer saccharum TaxID=4024 RepID=A0AA39RLN1_ACESA|nr:hypothetical protein LWI29_012864 [Acer saccharum]
MQLKLQLQTLKKGGSSMSEYLMKKKSIMDALAYTGTALTTDDKIMYILNGLGAEYDSFVIPITSMLGNYNYSLPEISALLLTHEARIEQHNQTEVINVNLVAGNQVFNQNKKGNQAGYGRGLENDSSASSSDANAFIPFNSQESISHLPDSSEGLTQSFIDSGSPLVNEVQPTVMSNTHPMITRAKARIYRPKALLAETIAKEPSTVKEALASSE